MTSLRAFKFNRYTLALAIVWGLCLLTLGAGFFLFHLPQRHLLARVQGQYRDSAEQRQLAETARSDAAQQKARQRHEAAQQEIGQLATSPDRVTGLIFQIGKQASDLALAEFSSKQLQSKSAVSTVGKSKRVAEAWLEVEFQASFEQALAFVHRLEQSAPAVFVETLALYRGDGDESKHSVRMELSFLTTTDEMTVSVAMR